MAKRIKNTTVQIKKTNVELVKGIMKEQKISTCTEVSLLSGLSIATCRTILNSLVKTGEVTIGEPDLESGGRPAKTYVFNENHQLGMALSLDVNGIICDFRHMIFNLNGDVIDEKTDTMEDVTYEILYDKIKSAIEKYPTITSISIAIPGVSDINGTIIVNDIASLNGVPLASNIKGDFNLKVKVSSTPDVIAYGYYKSKVEDTDAPYAALYFPKDQIVGAGIIINERIFKGFCNTAGEINYLYDGGNDFSKRETTELAALYMSTISTTISPKSVLVTGHGITKEQFDEAVSLQPSLNKSLHPEFEFIQDPFDMFTSGIISIAVDNLSDTIQLMKL